MQKLFTTHIFSCNLSYLNITTFYYNLISTSFLILFSKLLLITKSQYQYILTQTYK